MSAADGKRLERRAHVLVVVLWAGLGAVAARAVQLQVTKHEDLRKIAEEEYLNDLKIPARRGHVYDRNGKPLAISVDVPSVYADPMRLDDPRDASRRLADVLGLPLETVYQRLASERMFVWLKRQVAPEVAERVTALDIPGVAITRESRRFYPNREVGAHIVGFSGVDAKGLEGIERELDEELAGEPQVIATIRDARGNNLLNADVTNNPNTSGADVWLALDLQIQHAAQVAVRRAVETHEATAGVAVVLDVPTGEILAVAVEPHFNPNEAGKAPASQRRNRALTDMFEPGSALKPLVIASALDLGIIEAKQLVFCENGSVTIGGHTIRDTGSHGWLDITGVVQKSSNIGAAKIGAELGRDQLDSALRAYGFGRKTGVRFPGETAGIVRDPSTWSEVGVATISFGQGIAVNAVQFAAAYRVLASGGEYRAPTLVKRIEHPERRQDPAPRARARRVLRRETTVAVTRMLEAATSAEGTGYRAQIAGYRVAGKTGTAQKADPAGGYSSDRFMAVFAGYAPAQAPRVVVVVAIDEPKDVHSGGTVAAPVFAEVVEASMTQLGVLPSKVVDEHVRSALARVSAMTTPEVEPALDAPQVAPGTLPSFVGLTAKEAVARYVELGSRVELAIEGSGRVVSQDPAPGSKDVHRVRLVLAGQ